MKIFCDNSRIKFIALILTTILSSCSSTYTVHVLTYNIECKNCGSVAADSLSVDLCGTVDNINDFYIDIQNNSSETIIMDERYFVLCDSDFVVRCPIGSGDPNMIYSWSHSTAVSYGSSDLLYNPFSKKFYRAQTNQEENSSFTSSTVQQPYLVIPAASRARYKLFDYVESQFKKSQDDNIEEDYRGNIIIKWDEVKRIMRAMDGKNLKITLTYRTLNDEAWHSKSVSFSLFNVRVKDHKYKE